MKIRVELAAANQEFTWWTTHPEHGSEEGHGPGHEEGGEEHGGGSKSDRRPKDASLRPLYNQLLLLQREVAMLKEGLRTRKL